MRQNQNLPRTGGQILVDQLRIHGVDHVFCVPGESYLAVLDALYDSGINVTVCRQEGGAAMMAEAHGKLTGKPAACFVTRAPGATNATPGVHVASHDSTPLLVFVGQVQRGVREREALQELDYRAVFRPMAKWATEIDSAARIPEIVSRAVHLCISGRPGPVVIGLPEDMLVESAVVGDARPAVPVASFPGPDQIRQLQDLLAHAEHPLIVLGGSRWNEETVARFAETVGRWDMPVAVSLRRQMLFPVDHPCYVGDLGFGPNPRLVELVKQADLIVLLGSRMSEVPSQGYTLLDIPVPQQTLVHVHPDAAELGRVYEPTLAINAAPQAFVDAVKAMDLPKLASRSQYRQAGREAWLSWSDTSCISSPGTLQMAEVMSYLNERLPKDAIICNGAGNYATWVHRFHKFRHFGTQLAPTSGSMGYGVPAAVGAKRLMPERTVIAFAGDGCFLMHGQEFATAVQYGLAVMIIIVDNGMLGTIRMHQEREYPGREVATSLRNPDFAAYAHAFGGHGERVVKTDEFPGAFERALASGKPSIIHCLIDAETINPSYTLSSVREAAIAAGR
ncbi:thiamine pyrophosphate-binding protein [Allopusillimonas soli]|uniref:Thiamine pyrophosphate-binding protein n=1 Tax=Allopusillimonas soli TaxID=659016 RepID=A0A853F7E5_9BURK|nr:thiamine pyrophosphate-binding protein [Allopusillimonas soli]NYT36023.1 thiamine pyrophosphate-binding protein [Allopusillimonas soli]TEA76366.1 thiamine pyrophosphate-binding protein [Allopusillimonas soli]